MDIMEMVVIRGQEAGSEVSIRGKETIMKKGVML